MNEIRLQQLKKIVKDWNTDPLIQHEAPVEIYICMFKNSIQRALLDDSDEALERVKQNLKHYKERIMEKKQIKKLEYKVTYNKSKIHIAKHG